MKHYIYETFKVGNDKTKINSSVEPYKDNTFIQNKLNIKENQTVIENNFEFKREESRHDFELEPVPKKLELNGQEYETFPYIIGIADSFERSLLSSYFTYKNKITIEFLAGSNSTEFELPLEMWEDGSYSDYSAKISNSTRIRMKSPYIYNTLAGTKFFMRAIMNNGKTASYDYMFRYIDNSIDDIYWKDDSYLAVTEKELKDFTFILKANDDSNISVSNFTSIYTSVILPDQAPTDYKFWIFSITKGEINERVVLLGYREQMKCKDELVNGVPYLSIYNNGVKVWTTELDLEDVELAYMPNYVFDIKDINSKSTGEPIYIPIQN